MANGIHRGCIGVVNSQSLVPTVSFAGGQFPRQISVTQTHGIQRGSFQLKSASRLNWKIQPSAIRDRRRKRESPSRATWSSAVTSELESENGAAKDSQVAAIQEIAGCVKVTQHVETGGLMTAYVARTGDQYDVLIDLDVTDMRCRQNDTLLLHWGIFRSNKSTWYPLELELTPPNTTVVAGMPGAFRTPLSDTDAHGHRSLRLSFDASLAPFSLSFALFQPAAVPAAPAARATTAAPTAAVETEASSTVVGSAAGGWGGVAAEHLSTTEKWLRTSKYVDFCVPVGMRPGSPSPLGASLRPDDGSVNFALFSQHAEGVTLCLYEPDAVEPDLEIDLHPSTHRTGDVWHVNLTQEEISPYTRYGYQCRGNIDWQEGHRFHPHIVLLDPYAKLLAEPVEGQEESSTPAAILGLIPRPVPVSDSSSALFVHGVERVHGGDGFDWENVAPPRLPAQQLVVYRACAQSFASEEGGGAFLGVAAGVGHLKKLGVNAILLQPIAAFDETQGSYFPISLFAPMPLYGPQGDCLSASLALKTMVRELHRVGIEVYLEVVVSHTAECGDSEPKPLSFRGIDNKTYYLLDSFGEQVKPHFGSSNQLNCNQPIVQSLILDSLRHWVSEYRIDGFSFVNSQALLSGPHGQQLSRPVVVESIAFEPMLGGARILADTCSPLSATCETVNFPHWRRWSEFNHSYCFDARRFLRGEGGQIGRLATRICGSADIFSTGRTPSFGFNYVTAWHGLTLADLVSYSLEEEASWNCGCDGPTEDDYIALTRIRQVRNFLTLLFLSLGVPVLTSGDEYGRTKSGSRTITDFDHPFEWQAVESDVGQVLTEFIAGLAAFRRRRGDLFQRRDFLAEGEVTWHGPLPLQPEWSNPESAFLAFTITPRTRALAAATAAAAAATAAAAAAATTAPDAADATVASSPLPPPPAAAPITSYSRTTRATPGDVYAAFNAHHHTMTVNLPEPTAGMKWHRVLDTNMEPPLSPSAATGQTADASEILIASVYDLPPFSSLVLEARIAV